MPSDASSSPAPPVDPTQIATKAEFAAALASLTRRQVRGLAERSNVARSTISGWATGQSLPNPNQIDQLRKLLAAVGLSEADQDAWVDAVLRVRQSPVPRGQDPARSAPYLGLAPFEEQDADRFFGREDVVAAVARQVLEVMADRSLPHRFVFLIGASGEGKSSILRAGVVVALRAVEGITCELVQPANEERIEFAGDAHHVIVIDQFEQVFQAGRSEVLEAVIAAASAPDGPTVVAAVRSDFYARLVDTPAFSDALVSHQIVLAPMTEIGMRRAIVEPARRSGVDLEAGLVEMMLHDVAPATALESRPSVGVLPLLSHALLETWARGSGRQLRVADYTSLGGLNGAIEKTAEVAYGRLDPPSQDAAADLFRRLVNIDEEGLITRRHASLAEIAEADGGEGVLTSVMWHFVAARLVTVDETTVTLSHEVLLRAWSRLREWIADGREAIRIHREIGAAARTWHESGDDEGSLLAGGRLERAKLWLESPVGSRLAGPDEQRFVQASDDRARRRALQARRRLRGVAALAAATSVFGAAAGFSTVDARRSRRDADEARVGAEVRDLANRAQGATDPYVGAFYALEAMQWTDEPRTVARTAWLEATQRIGRQSVLQSGYDLELGAADLAFDPAGELLAALAPDGAIHLIDAETREDLRQSEPTGIGVAIAWSPDGTQLVTSGGDGVVRRFDAATLEPTADSTDVGLTTAKDVAWSPDGSTIAVTNNEGTLTLLAAETMTATGAPIPTGTSGADRTAWRPDGARVATTNFQGELQVIDAATSEILGSRVLAGGVVANGLAWNPEGTVIAVTSSDTMVRFFDDASLEQLGPPISTGSSYALDVIWNAAGTELATVNADGTLRVLTAVDHRPTGDPVRTGDGSADAVTWSPDGRTIVTANNAGNVRFFSVPEGGSSSTVYGSRLAVSPDLSTFVTTNFDDTIRAYSLESFLPAAAPVPAGGTDLRAIAWNPAGAAVATGSSSGAVSLLDPKDLAATGTTVEGAGDAVVWLGWSSGAVFVADAGGRVARLDGTTLSTETETDLGTVVTAAALDPSAEVVAVGAENGGVELLSSDDLGRGRTVATGTGAVTGLAWTSGGSTLATANADGTVQVVDPTSGSVRATYALAEPPTQLAWNPSGDVLAVGTTTGSVWFFDTELEQIGPISPSDAAVTGLVWLPDGTALLSSHANGYTVRSRAWAMTSACRVLTGVLSPEVMDRLIDIPDSTSHCRAGDVKDHTPLPGTGVLLP